MRSDFTFSCSGHDRAYGKMEVRESGETTLAADNMGTLSLPRVCFCLYIYAFLDSSLKIITTLAWEPINIYCMLTYICVYVFYFLICVCVHV